jgi:3-hydroxyacyl-CoA dehydrogenase
MHFFSPANVMPLLEVVRARKSGKDVVHTAMTLSKKIGKTAVLSRVGPGFIANRVMTVRGQQANAMVLEGVSPADIDRVIFDYGFAMGPFQMMDLVGLDVIGRDSNVKTVSSELVRRDRLGQKKNGGYYDYDENRKATGLSPIALEIIREVAKERGVAPHKADDAEILARLLYPVVNEGAKVLAEGVALRASDIDIACIKGYNWPLYRGGPMFWADLVGLPAIVSKLKEFEKRLGEAFAPSPFLEKLAREDKKLSAAEGV